MSKTIFSCSATACGKTHYPLSMQERDYIKHFENIILLCSTFEWNRTCYEWKYNDDPDFIAIPCDQDNTNAVLKYVVDLFNVTKNLFILDDCVSGQEIKNRTIEVVKLGFSEEEVKQQLRKFGATLGNRKLRTSQTTTSTKHRAQLVRLSDDGEIDQSVKHLNKASAKALNKLYA